jgi:membrane protease YdiL (CAAX protease family)
MLAPEDASAIRLLTIYQLPAGSGGMRDAAWIGLVGLIAWVGALAFVGRYRRRQVAQILFTLGSADLLFWSALVLSAVLGTLALLLFLRRGWAAAAFVVTAFLLGHVIYAWMDAWIPRGRGFGELFRSTGDGLRFALSRLVYGAAVVGPMLAAWRLVVGRSAWSALHLGMGDMRVCVRDLSARDNPQPAWRALVGGYGAVCLILFVLLQGAVDFRPLTGALWPLLPAVLLAAGCNALAEEVVFRGVLQTAFIRAAGVRVGLWGQGLVFGLMHWGLSVGVVAALPASLLIGLGSVAWGKYSLDTRGLGWVVIAHGAGP